MNKLRPIDRPWLQMYNQIIRRKNYYHCIIFFCFNGQAQTHCQSDRNTDRHERKWRHSSMLFTKPPKYFQIQKYHHLKQNRWKSHDRNHVFRISASAVCLTKSYSIIFFHKICLLPAKIAFIESLYKFLTSNSHIDVPQVKVSDATFIGVIFRRFFCCRSAAAAMIARDLSSFIFNYLTLPNRWAKYHRTKQIYLLAKFIQ